MRHFHVLYDVYYNESLSLSVVLMIADMESARIHLVCPVSLLKGVGLCNCTLLEYPDLHGGGHVCVHFVGFSGMPTQQNSCIYQLQMIRNPITMETVAPTFYTSHL